MSNARSHTALPMKGVKRQADTDAPDAARKRRAVFSENDTQLAKIYNNLAEDVQETRLQAAGELVKHISKHAATDSDLIEKSLTRLVKGLCSSRKAARLGFSVALGEVLRLALAVEQSHTLGQVIAKTLQLTSVDGRSSAQETRDALLGRQFALQAVLQTGTTVLQSVSLASWQELFAAIVELAQQRQWLRKQCGAMLYDFVESASTASLGLERVQAMVDALSALWKTPEGVALWLSLSHMDGVKLPKHVWHHRDPFSAKERHVLNKIMQEITTDEDDQQKGGARQITPSFAWSVVLKELNARESLKDFNHFWDGAVSHGLFSLTSSNERKALGLQVVTLALRIAPSKAFEQILSHEVVRCIINHRSNEDRYLSQATKGPLNEITARVITDPSAAASVVSPLLRADMNFDHTTKTKTVETVLGHADAAALNEFQKTAQKLMLKAGGEKESQTEARRRTLADLLVSTLRSHRDKRDLFFEKSGFSVLLPWVEQLLRTLLSACYKPLSEAAGYEPAVSVQTRSALRGRLASCIGQLLSFPVELACLAPDLALAELQNQKVLSTLGAKKSTVSVMKRAEKARKAISNGAVDGLSNSDLTTSHALHLLLGMSMLQVYNEEPDAVSALEDLLMSIESWDQSAESKTVLIEIVLSFMSKPSTIFKRLAEQVFAAFALTMTSDSLRSMLEILEQKESASGQQELFDQHGETQMDDEGEEESDSEGSNGGEFVDVEDDSDVELVNGVVTAAEDDSVTTESSQEEDDDTDDDELAEFDRKLADALGTAAVDEDEDEDGSDMDDEQMMALEPHLANIFKERQKQSSTKQDNKDARENIVNFKNRVLDLLGIYVKAQYASEHALELIHPLVVLVRTTSSKVVAENAFAVLKLYFDAYNKHKAEPPVTDEEMLFALLALIQSEAGAYGSKMYASVCSRSGLFIAKILVAINKSNYEKVASLYAKLQSEWYLDAQSKMQSSVFTEWTSWTISTRGQHV